MEIKKNQPYELRTRYGLNINPIVILGSFVQDLCFRTDSFPLVGETKLGTFSTGIGGKGANAAIACNRQLYHTNTKFIGCIGNDSFGMGALNFFRDERLDYYLHTSENPSGTASIIVDKNGKNSIVVALGANNDLKPYTAEIEEQLKDCKILVCQLESNLDTTYKALEMAKKNHITTILNPAPMNIFFDISKLQYVDILTPNESEFDFLFKCIKPYNKNVSIWSQGYSDDELHSLCREIGVDTIIITLGEKGCFVSTPIEYYRVSACKINTIDTAGAGDAFTGSLAAALFLFSGVLRKSVEYATVVAGLSTTKYGTAPSMPSRKEVMDYITKVEEQNAIHK